MAQIRTIVRPLPVVTDDEASSQSMATHESGTDVNYLDVTATINANLRLLGRIKLTTENAGANQRYRIQYLDFSSTADQTFTADQLTTPFTDAEADSITDMGYSPWVNMHAIYTTAGDTAGA